MTQQPKTKISPFGSSMAEPNFEIEIAFPSERIRKFR